MRQSGAVSESSQPDIDEPRETQSDEPAFIVDLDGFEGPLDLLLELARRQKVDLAQISILQLADQYLAFIGDAHALRLELAADYLVMAAWLAFLKSRLLAPERRETAPETSAGEMAAALSERLKRLDAVRALARMLEQRYVTEGGRLSRGAAADDPEPVAVTATLHDLVAAYAGQRRKAPRIAVMIPARSVLSLADARTRITLLLDQNRLEWVDLARLSRSAQGAAGWRSIRASCFAAALELAREGAAELRQDRAFTPLLVRQAPSRSAEMTD